MSNQISGTNEAQVADAQADPWAAAFAALEHVGEEDAEATAAADGGAGGGSDQPAEGDGGQELPDNAESGVGDGAEGSPGDLDTDAGNAGEEIGNVAADLFRVDEVDIEQYRSELEERVRKQVIEDVAAEFVKQGVRNHDGILGVTLDDCTGERDADGVPTFFNPDTGLKFGGDDPRSKAITWVKSYNEEIARVFNNACAQYEQQLMEQRKSEIAVIEFAPKYNKLDPIRRGMFENVIEDYEVKDADGKVVGYSCDLDKALALVDRQVSMIQNYAKQQQASGKEDSGQQTGLNANPGPALDMKTSSGAMQFGDKPPVNSLAEAMERQQDELLEKLKQKDNR